MALTNEPGDAVARPEDKTPTSALVASPARIEIPDSRPHADELLAPIGMEEPPTGGFHGVLEVIPTKADLVIDLIRANSLWPLLSGLSCCAIEMMSTATSKNDIDRFGMFPFRASPRQADVLIVAGTLTAKMAGPLVRLWEQMPEPKWCVAMGTCTTSGGRFKRSYSVVQGVDRVMPVDVYVPGCPPRPEGLIYGLLKLRELVMARRGKWRTYVDRGPQRVAWEGDVRRPPRPRREPWCGCSSSASRTS